MPRQAKVWSTVLGTALVSALAVGIVTADFNSKDARKAGFAAGDKCYNGVKLDSSATNNEQKKVDDAIQKLKDTPGGDPVCEMGLMMMNMNHRICKETGDSNNNNAATTLPDGKAGAGGDGINVNPNDINGPQADLACILVHEWVHVNQTGPYPELPAFEAEKKCLEDLGATGTANYKFVCCQVASLKGTKTKEADPTQPRLPMANRALRDLGSGQFAPQAIAAPAPTGFAEVHLGPATFFVVEVEGTLHGFLPQDTGFQLFPLSAGKPLNLVPVAGVTGPTGGPVLAVSGVTAGNGSIEYVEVDPASATVRQSLLTVPLPGTRPLGMAASSFQGISLLYVLDTQNQLIVLLYDADGDGLAETPLVPVWATSGTFPALATARSIRVNTAMPLSVLVSDRDLRIEDSVRLGHAVTALADLDANGIAETAQAFAENDLVAVIPWPFTLPVDGDTQVSALATTGSTIELWQSDAAGSFVALLGTTTVGADNAATFALLTPLVRGEYLLVRDATFPFPDPPVPFQVQ